MTGLRTNLGRILERVKMIWKKTTTNSLQQSENMCKSIVVLENNYPYNHQKRKVLAMGLQQIYLWLTCPNGILAFESDYKTLKIKSYTIIYLNLEIFSIPLRGNACNVNAWYVDAPKLSRIATVILLGKELKARRLLNLFNDITLHPACAW